MESELRNAEQNKKALQQSIKSNKAQKSKCEDDLAVQKRRHSKQKDKLERQKTAFCRVETDLDTYVSAAKKFESSASDKAQHNTNSVEKCISSIEEYLTTTL